MPEVEQSRSRAAAAARPGASGSAGFWKAALLGSVLTLVVNVWMLAGPDVDLVTEPGLLSSVFDAQGRALLEGHLYVDPDQVSVEGFVIDGRTYTYLGLFPALLRMPVLLVTDSLDGRLTQLSMLLALAVLLAAGAALQWQVRRQVCGDRGLDRADRVAAFLLPLALGVGAVPLYLASRPVIYHEAELWGAGLAIAALAAAVAVLPEPSPKRIAWAGGLACLALHARFSVGLGPVVALGLMGMAAAAGAWPRVRERRLGRLLAEFGPVDSARATAVMLLVAAAIPVALHAGVNYARFSTPFGIPLDKQVASMIEPTRQAALAANGDSLFGLKFVPTTLLQAVRPDAVGRTRAFPFVGLPSQPAKVIGDVTFDTIQPSLSVVTGMPALLALSVLGAVAMLRRRRLRPLLGMLVATASGFAVTLTIAFVTTRYLADFLPFFLLASVVGMSVLVEGTRRRGWALAAVAALTVAGLVINASVGLVGQRLLYPDATEAQRVAFVRAQDDVDRALGRAPDGVHAGPVFPDPPRGAPGDLFVLGDCDGLFVQGLDRDWRPVERTERSGLHRLRVRFPARPRRTEALLTLGTGARPIVIASRGTAGRAVFEVREGGRVLDSSGAVAVRRGSATRLAVAVDPFYGGFFTNVRLDGRIVVTAQTPDVRRSPAQLGEASGGLPRFSGSVASIPFTAPLCRDLRERGGAAAG